MYGYVWYIYLHEWLIFYGFNVGKYTSPMAWYGYQILRVFVGDPWHLWLWFFRDFFGWFGLVDSFSCTTSIHKVAEFD